MNEVQARQMIEEIDNARYILKQIESVKTKQNLILGTRESSGSFSYIYGVSVPNKLKDRFLRDLKDYASNVLIQYGLKL